jgi:hypothetical protein
MSSFSPPLQIALFMHAQKVQPKTFEIFSWQWALGSKKANKREHMAKIRHQQAIRNQPLRLGFLNSDLPAAYCLLRTATCQAWFYERTNSSPVNPVPGSVVKALE